MGKVLAGLFVIGAWLTFVIGWILNIIQLVGMADGEITVLLILKIVGVFAAPLGVILGIVGLF